MFPNGATYYRRARWRKHRREVVCGPHQRQGYARVGFTLDGVRYRVLVHRAVWWVYGGIIPDGMQVNHRDGNKANNDIDNLELVTPRGNVAHAEETGLARHARGERQGAAKLTNAQAIEVRQRLAAGERGVALAREYRVSPSTVSRVGLGRTYKGA